MSKQTNLDVFLKDVEEQEKQDRETTGSGEFEERSTLQAERDILFEGYFIESYQSGIEGKFGDNTAVRITSPTGEKQTLWVNGFEEQHFLKFIEKTVTDDIALPVKVSFLRTQKTSAGGNMYNNLKIRLDGHGDEVQSELDSF
jgi:hypothetical protein